MTEFSDKVALFFVRLAVDEKFAKTFDTDKKKAFTQAGLSKLEGDEVNQAASFKVVATVETKAGTIQQQTHTGKFTSSKKAGS